jgi:GTP-binding protein
MTSHKLYQNATFLLSVASLEQLPPDKGIEVAFIGRSNSGKSTAINTIVGVKGLARSSKTPGRTQMINFFRLDDERRFVDLPGYGYANVPLQVKQRWQETIDNYLQIRRSLKGLMLTMDIRHPLKASDQQVIQWASFCAIPLHILLTKCDKLNHGPAAAVLHQVRQDIEPYKENVTVQLFSAMNRIGLDQVWERLNLWLL